MSPDYPDVYQNYMYHLWVVTAPLPYTVRLEIKDFQVDSYDRVYVGSGNVSNEGIMWAGKGSSNLRVILSTVEEIWVLMSTGQVLSQKGFVFYLQPFNDSAGTYFIMAI